MSAFSIVLLVIALALVFGFAIAIARQLESTRRLPPPDEPRFDREEHVSLSPEPAEWELREPEVPAEPEASETPSEPEPDAALALGPDDVEPEWTTSRWPTERIESQPLIEEEVLEPVVEPAAAPRSRRAPPPWYPVVLAHGVLGFDALRMGFLQPQYFRGVAKQLRAAGNEVHVVRVSPVAGIAVRAAQLAEQIRSIPAERVNVIAHSMGGLDARYAISRLGLADRVASLTTIGTPHRGTPLADSGMWLVQERLRLRKLLEVMGIDAFSQLTTGHLEVFNESVQDVSTVHYASCPARIGIGVRGVNSLLAPGYVLLEREVGDNDGVVPTESQRWGEVLDEIDADHWAQVGWSLGFDAVGFYDQLVRALRRRRL